MNETHQHCNSRKNELREDSGLLWMPAAPERRPELPPLRCPHSGCGGQLYPELDIPGLFDLKCLLCSRTIGEVLEEDLEQWAGHEGVTRAKGVGLQMLWVRDEAVA
jgi:hypothetical protein